MSVATSRKQTQSAFEKFILHLHPHVIDERAIKFNRTFGLGGISALLFVVLVVSGLILRFSYIPTVEHAYDSIVALQNHSKLGGFIRNLHHVSASFLVIVSFLHLVRVYYAQSIFKKRGQNWIFGLVLLFLVLASNFTGYLLPWDQLSYWAVTVMTQMLEYIPFAGKPIANFIRSGDVVNGGTLLNFYNLHTGILPIFFIVLMSFHFWLVRRAGGVALPEEKQKVKVPVLPNLVLKELLALTLILAGIFVVSVFYQAPLLEQANPLQSPNPAKAPWYFLGAQELLLHLHPIFAAFIIPLGLTVYFFMLPKIGVNSANVGTWFNTVQGKKSIISTSVFTIFYTVILTWLFEHVFHFNVWMSHLPGWLSNGVVPVLVYVIPVAVFLYLLQKRNGNTKVEWGMSVTTVILTAYLVMMTIALLFRGNGMQLVF